ncbi:hypothetical protein [Candidatus Harpocratesius sp.]
MSHEINLSAIASLSFADFLNSIADASIPSYIGPRAIFNSNFIPPKIVPRRKKSELIYGILKDALEDEYATNLTLYGLQGAGKNLLLNLIFKWYQSQPINDESCLEIPIIISNDCRDQELGQLLFEILHNLNDKLEIQINLSDVIQWDAISLWNSFKYLVQKSNRPIILYLQRIEYVKEEIIAKILNFAKKTENLHVITSIDTGNQFYAFNQYTQLDHRIHLNIFSNSELYEITSQRSIMAFHNLLEPEAIKLLVDYIIEYGTKVPGSCINLLKRIYPIVEEQGELLPEDIRKISQYYFEGVSIDSLAMTDYVMRTSLEERLFLDYLVNYFKSPNNYYISNIEIKKAYQMTADEMGFTLHSREFQQRFENITRAQILQRSHFNNKKNSFDLIKTELKERNDLSFHFLSLPMEEINQILEMSFGIMPEEK